MTKFVFIVTMAILATVLYNIPAHSRGMGGNHGAGATPTGTPTPNAKAMQNSNGQFQADRKFGKERAAERKSTHAKSTVPSADQPKQVVR